VLGFVGLPGPPVELKLNELNIAISFNPFRKICQFNPGLELLIFKIAIKILVSCRDQFDLAFFK
jgi:hypothetical protein